MSPEAIAPGNLIFVDTWLQDGRLLGRGERITSHGFMTVSWYAIGSPAGSHALGDGVAYIYDADRLTVHEIAAVRVPRAAGSYYWRDKSFGTGLMFVLWLPEGQKLANPDPMPREAKAHHNRISVYWKPEATFNTETVIRWQLIPLQEDAETAAEKLNEQLQQTIDTPSNPNVQVTDDGQMRVLLRDLLLEGFSNNELADLAFELGVDVEDLPDERSNRARELVSYLSRRGRLPELVAAGLRLRPNLAWPPL